MIDRRTVLSTASLVLLTGCSSGGAGDTPTETTSPTPTERMTATAALDLREANVVDVVFDGTPGSEVRFDVTLFHDDDGEDGYANWWQVETLDGTRLGRRELLHAHSTDPFTRSATIAIPADQPCVVVRGHDQTHGYGGRALLTNLETGATRRIDQGPDPTNLEGASCP